MTTERRRPRRLDWRRLAAAPVNGGRRPPSQPAGRRRSAAYAAALVLVLFLASSASACPVCWGSPDDPMVKSANNGIWVLLGVVGFVQIGFAALFISLWRRARAQQRFRESLHVIEGGPLS